MEVRLATTSDIEEVMELMEAAKKFMRACGNDTQWVDGYPQRELMLEEIRLGHCYLCLDGHSEVVGTFCYIEGEEPTYQHIEGRWLNDRPYATIHRVASNGKAKGILERCLDWSFQQIDNIRIDTHADNFLMQKKVRVYGFKRCGIIYVSDGSPRTAFQKEVGPRSS